MCVVSVNGRKRILFCNFLLKHPDPKAKCPHFQCLLGHLRGGKVIPAEPCTSFVRQWVEGGAGGKLEGLATEALCADPEAVPSAAP